MELEWIAALTGGCAGGDCPNAYLTDRGTALIQGDIVTDPKALARLGLPAGETAVEVPVELIRNAAAEVIAREGQPQ